MNPSASDPRAQENAQRSQYHHFIPRFILRGFAQDPPAINRNNAPTGASKKQRNKKKKANKNGLLRFIRTQDGSLSDGFLSREYGMVDMYRDMHAPNQHELEEKLALLETHAGEVIARARDTFKQSGTSLTLSRGEKDTLRKFLFLMKYRNSQFCSRFDVATIEEYMADDKEKMRQYMQRHGFQSPRGVWLANMHAFLDIVMDPRRKWQNDIRRLAYPDDATLFILHVDHGYVAFCKPVSADDEFLLTDNVFGIFEGPNNLQMKPGTSGLSRRLYTEWHNFAPVSSSLLIILRSNYLPSNITDPRARHLDEIYRTLLAMHPVPENAVSILQDLPVQRCPTSYASWRSGQLQFAPEYRGPSPSDLYTFQCFELESRHVNLINSIFLEEAMAAQSVTFKSESSIVRSIKAYLEDSRPGFKRLFERGPERRQYLQGLETALRTLGGSANTVFNSATELSFLLELLEHPLDYGGHMARWVTFCIAEELHDLHPQLIKEHLLLGDTAAEWTTQERLRWFKHIEQAGKILFLHIKTDTVIAAMTTDTATKKQCKIYRQMFFASLQPQAIWLYVKAFRNLEKFDLDDFTTQHRPLDCNGPEDEVFRNKNRFRHIELSGAMLYAAGLL